MTRVLIVEDDRAILRGLKDNFEAESYEVLTAAGHWAVLLITPHQGRPAINSNRSLMKGRPAINSNRSLMNRSPS